MKLADIAAGDTVTLVWGSSVSRHSNRSEHVVTRTTRAFITLDDGMRYHRATGRLVGESSWGYRAHIEAEREN